VSPLDALDHVIVAVRDLDAAERRHGELLGRRVSWRGEHPGLGTANALFRLDGLYLELLAARGEGPLATALRARLAGEGEGALGLALRTADAEATAADLRRRGLAVGAPQPGEGREAARGAVRRWRSVLVPADAARGLLVLAIEHLSPADALPPAEPCVAHEAAVTGIDHVVVRTESPEAAIHFYGEQLGLRLALDRTFEAWGARLLFFRVGSVTVEVAAPTPPVATPGPRDHLWGISWRVPDAGAARERLRASGFDVSEVRAGRKPGTRVCTVRDGPCGVATLLIEPGAHAAHQ
jgi:catechol 2,3-dioxygenase-like lactoylglutathione lyase family enzyme